MIRYSVVSLVCNHFSICGHSSMDGFLQNYGVQISIDDNPAAALLSEVCPGNVPMTAV